MYINNSSSGPGGLDIHATSLVTYLAISVPTAVGPHTFLVDLWIFGTSPQWVEKPRFVRTLRRNQRYHPYGFLRRSFCPFTG